MDIGLSQNMDLQRQDLIEEVSHVSDSDRNVRKAL